MHWKTIISTKCCIQPSCNTPHRSSCPSRQNVTYSHQSTYRYHNKIHAQKNFLNNLNVLLTITKFNNKIPSIYNKIQQLIYKMCNNNNNNNNGLLKWVCLSHVISLLTNCLVIVIVNFISFTCKIKINEWASTPNKQELSIHKC